MTSLLSFIMMIEMLGSGFTIYTNIASLMLPKLCDWGAIHFNFQITLNSTKEKRMDVSFSTNLQLKAQRTIIEIRKTTTLCVRT